MTDKLEFTCKWCCDGSSGHVEYNQSLAAVVSDKSLLLACIIPLSLQTISQEEYWRNKSPSSTRFSRPISFEFTKETKEKVLILVEKNNLDIAALKNTEVVVCGKQFSIKHNFVFTMLDGKTAQTVTGTSSAPVCYMCKAKPTEMNNLNLVSSKDIDGDGGR